MKLAKKIIGWIITIYAVLFALILLPSAASIISLLIAAIALPIAKVKETFHKLIPKKWARVLLAAFLVIIWLFAIGSTSSSEPPDPTFPTSASTEPSDTHSTTLPNNTHDTTSPADTSVPDESHLATSNTVPTSSVTNNTVPQESSFEVHYIDVGQADAALVLCDGHAMLIDGGNAADSNLIYTYLKKHSVSHLDYIVATHAHEDHVGGLSGALNYATVGKAYCPVTSYDSKAFSNFVNNLSKQGISISVPKAGDYFHLGSAEVQILGPITSSGDANSTSIVLRIVYRETSFLFTGDAERAEERDILNAGYSLESTVLKVGHHGSDTSTTYPFLREIMPQYAVISVGKDNSYGHPTEDTLSRLRDADVTVYRTDMQGDIICTSDGKAVHFTVSRNANADTLGSIGSNSTQTTPPTTESPTTVPPTTAPLPLSLPLLKHPLHSRRRLSPRGPIIY